MSTPVVQVTPLNPTEKVEIVEPKPFPGYYINEAGQKVTPNGEPWKAPRAKKAEEAEETPESTPTTPTTPPSTPRTTRTVASGAPDPVTGRTG